MKKGILFLLIAFFGFSDCLNADQVIYMSPESIFLRFEPVRDAEIKETILMRAEINTLVGNPTDFIINFYASADIEVETDKITFERLAKGDPKVFFVKLKQGSGKSDDRFTWVKMRVEFHPDHDALIKAVMENKKEYSHHGLRDRLISILFSEKEKSQKMIHVIGHPFLSGLNFKR